MRPLRRILAGAAALVTLTFVAGACDSSPFAASVNGHVIKQTALNLELRERSANKGYIAAVDSDASQSGVSVQGSAPGAYSTGWTAQVLSDLIDASVLHQHLTHVGDLPTAEELTVATALSAATSQQNLSFYKFPASLRAMLAERFADEAQVFPPYALTASEAQQLYAEYAPSLFSEVCIRISDATDAAQAAGLVRSINRGGGSEAGSVTCYDQAAFETLPLTEIQTVLKLADHKATVVHSAALGYQVTAVASRTLLPVDAAFLRAVAVAAGSDVGDQRVTDLLASADVKVNPAYGTWTRGGARALRVVPPTVGLGSS